MKLNRKWLMVIALVLSLTMATAGTLAYLTDSATAKNTFTIGDVEIEVVEPSWDPEDQPTLLPGVEIEKDPQIKNAGNTEAWVWMEIVIPAELYDIIELDYSTNGWTKGDVVATNADGDKVVLMKYDSKLAAGDTTIPAAFTTVSIPTSVSELPEGMKTADIVVNAYAIQAEKIGSIEDAIKAYNGEEITPDEPANGDDDSVTYEAPADAHEVSTSGELTQAVANGYTVIKLADGAYDVDVAASKELHLYGSKNAVLKLTNEGEDGCDYGFGSAGKGVGKVNFYGLTIDTTGNTGNYKGYAYMGATFNDCSFIGAYSLNNKNTFEFNYCDFDFKNGYFWTWGAENATFNNCDFNGNSKCILAHGRESTQITINNCKFAATEKGFTGAGHNTACVEIDPVGSNTYTINFTGTNTKTDSYFGWTRVKDDSTGHNISGVN